MSDNLPAINSNCPAKAISQDDLFELELIQDGKVSNLLFLIGTLIAIYANDKEEEDILCPEENQTFNQNTVSPETSRSYLIVIFNLLFLAGGLILVYTSVARLKKEESEISEDSSISFINSLRGSEIIVIGAILRVIGYALAAIGNKIKADNPV